MLPDQESLCLFDADGVHLGNVEPEDTWIGAAGTGGDGRVYVSFREQMNAAEHNYCLAEVDFEKMSLAASAGIFPMYLPAGLLRRDRRRISWFLIQTVCMKMTLQIRVPGKCWHG